MKFIYSKYFIYPVFFATFLAFYSISSNIFSSRNDKFRLLEEDGLEKFCKENDDIYNYYYKSEKYEITEQDFGKIDSDSQIILDYINEDFASKYIFQYIWHTGKYVFFLILLIIIIILTIYYSIATCIRCCTESCCNFFNFECCKNKCLKKTICILIPFVYLIVFVLAMFSIGSAALTVQRFSGAICVGLQLVDTFIEGDRRNVHPKWGGVKIVSTVLGDLGNLTSMNNQEMVNNINNNKKRYSQKSEEWIQYLKDSYERNKDKNFTIKNPKMKSTDTEEEIAISPVHSVKWGPYNQSGTILSEIYNSDVENAAQINHVISTFEQYLYGFLGCDYDELGNLICTEKSKVSNLLNTGAEIIDQIEEPMSNIKTKVTTPVQNIYDQVNSTVMGIFGVVIAFVIIYCILVECLLSVFCCTKKCKCVAGCLKWVLCFIYYTSIFIVIIGFVLGIVIGVLGCLVKNMTQVIEYITSTENLNSTKPMIFGKHKYLSYLDVCLNGNGDMAEELKLIDSFDSIDNITDISDDTETLKNETNTTSPYIDNYIDYFKNLNKAYLNYPYYNVDGNEVTLFNVTERINEINNYVSGEYSDNKEDSCLINETWATETTKEGYTYDNTYPPASHDSHYLIYLYEDQLYNNTVDFNTRYQNACPTNNHPYTTVSAASSKFSALFKDIKDKIGSDEFSKAYSDDLNKLNDIFSQKNDYLIKSLEYATYPIDRIENTVSKYISGKDNIFSLLNCKFVGENKLLLMHVLYTSLGVYLDTFGIVTVLFSLFIFVGIIFILIVIKNSKLDTKGGADDLDLETLDDILKGNDSGEQLISSNAQNQELMSY